MSRLKVWAAPAPLVPLFMIALGAPTFAADSISSSPASSQDSEKPLHIQLKLTSQTPLAPTVNWKVSFTATFKNTSPGPIYITSVDVTHQSEMDVDIDAFMNTTPFLLNPGQVWSGELFKLDFKTEEAFVNRDKTLFVQILGGAVRDAELILGAATFSVKDFLGAASADRAVKIFQASYDCTDARTRDAKLVCRNRKLSYLDRKLADIVWTLHKELPPDEKKLMWQDQKFWLSPSLRGACMEGHELDESAAATNLVVQCMSDLYNTRIKDLESEHAAHLAAKHAKPEPIAQWKTYRNRPLGFELRYPPSAKVTKDFDANAGKIFVDGKPVVKFALANGRELKVSVHPGVNEKEACNTTLTQVKTEKIGGHTFRVFGEVAGGTPSRSVSGNYQIYVKANCLAIELVRPAGLTGGDGAALKELLSGKQVMAADEVLDQAMKSFRLVK